MNRLIASLCIQSLGPSKNLLCSDSHSHGPHIELYLAEEAIGLVKSLNWNVIKGPLWQVDNSDGAPKLEHPDDNLEFDESEGYSKFFDEADVKQGYKSKQRNFRVSHRKNYQNMVKENIKDGDFIYAPNDLKGVYYVSSDKSRSL